MKKEEIFMMVFKYTPNANAKPTEQQINDMHQAWGSFIGNITIQEKLISTHQLGSGGKQIHADGSITDGAHFSNGKMISGNMIIRANSLEEATEMAMHSPILKMGGEVEVRSIMPMES